MLWALALAGCAAGWVLVALAYASDHVPEPGIRAALLDWIVLPYILAGVVAWWRRPESRFGPLMVAAGFAMFLSGLQWSNAALPYTVGLTFDLLPVVLFLHVFLAFPDGRLQGRAERALVATGYVAALGLQLVKMLLGAGGPDNLLAAVTEIAAASTVEDVELLLLAAISLAGIGALAVRRRGSGRPLRRSVGLLVDSFALGLVMLALLMLAGSFGWPSFETIRRITFVVIGLAPVAFLIGLLSARLARSTVTALLFELRADPSPGDLPAVFGRALRDPSLTLAYWLPEFESWADLDGRAVELPAEGSGRATTLIARDGVNLAALVHNRSLNDEPELLDAVSAAAGIALENGRLHAELHARLEDLRGSRERVIEAAQQERQRLERNLHDGAPAALDRAVPEPTAARRVGGRRPGRPSAARPGEARDLAVAGGAARRRARPPSGRRQRAWAGGSAGVARRRSGGAGSADRRARGTGERAAGGGRLLRRLREPREHR